MSPFRILMLASVAALSLAACKDDSRTASSAPLPYVGTIAYAPPPDALPVAPIAPIAAAPPPAERYAWAERAYALDRAFEDAPPDYAFEYDGVEPWAWESEDRWTMYAEPVAAGYRYYYYRPGADYPYFVRDPEYGYGYDDRGRLTMVYTVAGALLAPSYLHDRAPVAGRYWARAREIRRAALQAPRRAPDRRTWAERAPQRVSSDRAWFQAARRQVDWRAYRQAQDRRDIPPVEAERERRRREIAAAPARPQADARRERDGQPAFSARRPEADRPADHEGRQTARRDQKRDIERGPANPERAVADARRKADRRDDQRQEKAAEIGRSRQAEERRLRIRQQAERQAAERAARPAASARQERPRHAAEAARPAAERGRPPGKPQHEKHGKGRGEARGKD